MVSTLVGQCEFPDYDKYGLICDEARFLCGYEMDGYTGRLLSDKSPQPQPFPLCSGQGTADNIQWFSFVPDDVNIEIILSYSNCTGNGVNSPGLQVGILNGCELDSDGEPLGSIFCIEGTNYSDIILSPDSLDIEVGQLYYLFIDGFANSACDFEIDVVQGLCVVEPDTTIVCEQDCGIIFDSDNRSCTLSIDTFAFLLSGQLLIGDCGTDADSYNTSLDSIICIEWNIQPNTGFNYISSSFEYFDSLGVLPTLILEWTSLGNYTIEPIIHFNPLFASCGGECGCTDDVVFSIEITETVTILLPEIELCPGECVDFCGQTYCQTGVYECFDEELCLLEILSVVEGSNIDIDKGLFFFCPGECFEFQNIQYCNEDNYTVSDLATCDTTYLFQLEELSFSVNLIQADNLINCTISQAFLEGDWNTNFTGNINSAWLSELGDTLTFGNNYIATNGGNYTFVAWPENMKECEISLTHTINKDEAIPSANLMAPLLNCNNPLDVISINTLDNIMTTEWTGPNGYTSSDLNPEVGQAGTYEVTITAANGCKLILSTEVMGDFESPDLEVDYGNLNCSENIPNATYTSLSSIVSHQWRLPNGSNSSDDILNLNDVGNYSIVVTASNGCTAADDFTVQDMSYDPSLQLNEDRIWRCNDTEIPFDLSSQEIPGLKYFWSDIEGAILSNSINLTISTPGVYILTTIDDNVECIGRDTVRIVVDPNPFLEVDLFMLSPLCSGGDDGIIENFSFAGGEQPYTFEIDGELYSESEINNIGFEAGIYAMNVSDVFGCTVSQGFEIPIKDQFTVTHEPDLSIRFGQTKTLTFETSLEENEIGLIEWSNEDGDILGIDREFNFVGKSIEFIHLRVEDLEGCEVVSQIRVDLSFDVDIYFPNVFSPNNDGNNDLFILYNNGYPEMADDLKIFDRSGELIYKSSHTEFNETKVGWDGTFNGDQCQPGVYVFMLEYTLMNGRTKTLSGSITLIR